MICCKADPRNLIKFKILLLVCEDSKNFKKHKRNIIKQLNEIGKDIKRKVCNNCHEIGHGVQSVKCKLNIEKKLRDILRLKNHILSQECLLGKTVIKDLVINSSKLTEMTPNRCAKLFSEIPPEELLNRPMDIDGYLDHMVENASKCYDCDKCLYTSVNKKWNNRIWKENELCDKCWCSSNYKKERDDIWNNIKSYKKEQCSICSILKTGGISERFHLDHINMFDKCNSICTMVNNGCTMFDIYTEIDKCQYLCISCHRLVTDIEGKLPFNRAKTNLTKKFNNGKILEEEYNREKSEWQVRYDIKMRDIYKKLSDRLNSQT
jgi:hypothetical protein